MQDSHLLLVSPISKVLDAQNNGWILGKIMEKHEATQVCFHCYPKFDIYPQDSICFHYKLIPSLLEQFHRSSIATAAPSVFFQPRLYSGHGHWLVHGRIRCAQVADEAFLQPCGWNAQRLQERSIGPMMVRYCKSPLFSEDSPIGKESTKQLQSLRPVDGMIIWFCGLQGVKIQAYSASK